MTKKGCFSLFTRDSTAIIGHSYIGFAAAFYLYYQVVGACVKSVFYKFLDYGNGTLYNFSCGNFISHIFFENFNHGYLPLIPQVF